MPILTLSISEGVLRFFCDSNEDNNAVFAVDVSIIIFANLINVGLSFILCHFIPQISAYFAYSIVIFLLSTVEASFSNIAKGLSKTDVFAKKGILYVLVFSLSNIVLLAFFNAGIEGYLTSYVLAYLLTCIYLILGTKVYKYKLIYNWDWKLFKSILSYSIPFIPAILSWWINSSSAKYVLLYWEGADANGLYSVAQKIPTIITAVAGIFTQAWQLTAMRSYGEKDFDSYFSKVFYYLSMILVFMLIMVVMFDKVIAVVLFKNDFFVAWKYVPILSLAAIFTTMSGFLASAFTRSKKTGVLFISTLVGAVVNVALSVVLVKLIGIYGAAVALVIGSLVMTLLRLRSLKGIVRLEVNIKKYFCR